MSRPNRHGERSGARLVCGYRPRADREVPASARPPALRPAVAIDHLKPGGLTTSPVQGRGARQRAGDEPEAHRSPRWSASAGCPKSPRRALGRAPPTDYPSRHSSCARHPLMVRTVRLFFEMFTTRGETARGNERSCPGRSAEGEGSWQKARLRALPALAARGDEAASLAVHWWSPGPPGRCPQPGGFPYGCTSSTRRLRARPASVWLEPTGDR